MSDKNSAQENIDWLKWRLTQVKAPAMFLAADAVDYAADQLNPMKKRARKFADKLRKEASGI